MKTTRTQQDLIPAYPGKETKYDIALSFAGEDRKYAEDLANALVARNIKVFYDKHEKALLFGKDLYSYLSNIYQYEALYCVMLISASYAKKQWTKHERQAAQARAFTENEEYILPIRLDDTEIPGLPPTIGYLDWFGENGSEGLADIIAEKLRPENYSIIYLANNIRRHYTQTLGRDEYNRSVYYQYAALALSIRDRLMERWKKTYDAYKESGCKRVSYFSMEFLMGRSLRNAILNLRLETVVRKSLQELTGEKFSRRSGWDMDELIDCEPDAGLGSGDEGGVLAACLIESCATLELPVLAYGLRYEYGMFAQTIVNGEQVERPDHWLRNGNIWEVERPEYTQRIKFGGHTERHFDETGHSRVCWVDTRDVLATPYDIPVPGYSNNTVNSLRLWASVATEEFDLQEFNSGDYVASMEAKIIAENITKILHPVESANVINTTRELRLQQQYFLASASIQDVIANWIGRHGLDFTEFAEKNCFQLNDTHSSIAVAELMRLFMDIHGFSWDVAWEITTRTLAYTNHTLIPENLELWPVSMIKQLLPRLLEIIFEINQRFLAEVCMRWPGDFARLSRMSIIEEGAEKQVRMAHLAIVGSFSVNGVSELHSKFLQKGMFRDFYELWPQKFNNKTNGVTPRRWLAACNPALAELISRTIGDGWLRDLSQIKKLKPFAENSEFRQQWFEIRQSNKRKLTHHIHSDLSIELNVNALFDVQVKRIHEYKRQLLNMLHVIHLYDRIKRGDTLTWTNRCVLMGGKAAPGNYSAKRIIKLINNVSNVINSDPEVGDKLKLVFLPNFSVSAMEKICPAADLTEQISTPGKEASGIGNMKLLMNGALTLGTLDGANIEMREEVGAENCFLFGLTADQLEEMRGCYHPTSIIEQDEDLRQVMALIECGHFNQFEPGIFDDLIELMKSPRDPWMTIADFRSYVEAQKRVELAYKDQENWTRMSILNCAASGKFSIDRVVREYNNDIWKLEAIQVPKVAD